MTVGQTVDLALRCDARLTRDFRAAVLGSLRELCVQAVLDGDTVSDSAVGTVTMSAGEWENGWFWNEDVTLHHLDGTRSDLDLSGTDLDGRLADLASVERPEDGDQLTVDLITGTVSINL